MLKRPLLLALVLATVLSAVPTSGGAQTPPRPLQPIGSGAQFVAPNAAFYLALHRDPGGEQTRLMDRLSSIYARSPELEGARSAARGALGQSIDDFVQGVDSWIGGEIFLAISNPNELTGFGSTTPTFSIDMDCTVPGFLFGAAIGDLAAFQRFLTTLSARPEQAGTRTTSESHNGVQIFFTGRSPEPGGGIYITIHRGYLLLSPSRDRLIEAIDREQPANLASAPAFQSALARFPEQPLAFLYASVPADQIRAGGARAPVGWLAGALRLAPDAVRVDVAGSVEAGGLSPATRALLEKAPNPLRSAGAMPTGTALFVGWDNLKLLWDQIVEIAWPSPDQYAGARRDFAQTTGLDLEDDIFGWMTGEVAVFVAPSREPQGALGEIGFGVLVEAKDRTVARQKLDKIMDAIRLSSTPVAQPTTEVLDEVPFNRLPAYEDTALYGGLVDQWVVVTSARSVAADAVAATKGRGSLASQPEYALVRSRLAERQQVVVYAAVPSLVQMTTSAIRAAGGPTDDVAAYVQPIQGIGLGLDFTVTSIDARLVAHVVVPDQPIALPPREPREQPRFRVPVSALVDASKHGGAWWADDEEPSPVVVPRRAQALEEFSRANPFFLRPVAVAPDRRIGRQERGAFDPDVIQPREHLILRVGSEGTVTDAEIAAYQDYARCGGTVILLSDARSPGTTDDLAAAFGLEVAGRATAGVPSGDAMPAGPILDMFADHPATNGAAPLPMDGGTGLVGWDEWTLPLGFLSEDSFLDLDGNGRPDADEPFAAPALAIRPYGRGTVVFFGTTSILDQPDHPLFAELLRFLFPEAGWP